MATVYVQNKNGDPLMPTTRGGHVRHLLKEGKARVVRREPFTIRLLYEEGGATQPVTLGIDPGRTNIGLAAVTEQGEALFAAELKTRNKDIPDLMQKRAAFRRAHRTLKKRNRRRRRAIAAMPHLKGRRIERFLPGYGKPVVCCDIRNREARFSNRRRGEGWLTPTANHLLQTHINAVRKVMRLLPVTDIVFEVNRFAFMQMDDPNIRRWQYQKGPLFGKGSADDAVFEQQEGKCLLCGEPIEAYHHIVPRAKGGSNTLDNKAGLCKACHHKVHTDEDAMKALREKKNGLKKKYHALSVLNQIIPYLPEALAELVGKDHVYAVSAADTKAFRDEHHVPKEHHLDAYCIACIPKDIFHIGVFTTKAYQMKQFRRHDRQACHQAMTDRVYVDPEGRIAATNRRKRTEQKAIDIAGYREAYGDAAVSRLRIKRRPPRYKDMARIMSGALLRYEQKLTKSQKTEGVIPETRVFVMQAASGKHNGMPDYYVSVDGERFRARRCSLLHNNEGICFVSNHS